MACQHDIRWKELTQQKELRYYKTYYVGAHAMAMHAHLHNPQNKYYQYNNRKPTLMLSYPLNSQMSAQINTTKYLIGKSPYGDIRAKVEYTLEKTTLTLSYSSFVGYNIFLLPNLFRNLYRVWSISSRIWFTLLLKSQ